MSAATTCTPSSDWVVTSGEPAATPYYAPSTSTNGRLVPVPSSAVPVSPVPADRRPQLDPLPQLPNREGSASRPMPADTEVFVRAIDNLDDTASSLDVGPPLVAPLSPTADAEVADAPTASVDETSFELIPVGLPIPTPSHESKIPTNEVWDDTGWRSEQ
jgi:hypothetical protein